MKVQAISGVKWSAIAKAYTTIVQVLQVAVLTRFLAKEDFGLMGIAMLVNTFCNIYVDMGMSAAAMHEKELSRQQLSSFYWLNLFLGLILSISISASSSLIASYYHREELVSIISLTSITIFIHSTYSLLRTMQQKMMNFKFMSIVDVFSGTLAFVVNVLFATHGYGVFSLVWAQLISGSFTAIAFLCISIIKEHGISLHFSIQEVKIALKVGMYQVGTSTLDFFSREMDSLIISSYMPMETFGVYTLCKNVTMRIYQIINPIVTNVLTPLYAKIQDDIIKLSDAYRRTVEMLGYVNFPIYGIIAICAGSIMSILYGDSYKEYSFVMSYLSIYYAFQSCGNPIGSLLVATGRTDRGFYWTVFRIAFTFVYLNIASNLGFNTFVIFIAIIPIVSAYPFWRLTVRYVCNISFYDSLMLSLKPMSVCLPLFPLFFLDKLINIPIASIPIVSALFVIGYYYINYIFRLDLQNYMLNILSQAINGRHKK